MLLLGAGLCVPFLVRERKALNTLVYGMAALLTVLAIIRLTGDTYAAWLSNSVFHAASAKGGSGTVLFGPLVAIPDTIHRILRNGPQIFVLAVGLLVGGALVRRFVRDTTAAVLSYGLLFLAVVFVAGRTPSGLVTRLNPVAQLPIYPACVWVMYRYFHSRRREATEAPTDPRELLLLIPAATLISAAASQGNGTSNSTVCLALLFLLSAYWRVQRPERRWLHDLWMAVVIAVALSGAVLKVTRPYAWNTYVYDPLFQNRQWYHHPVYGTMYAERDLIQFMEPLCEEVHRSGPHPELLSMPYSYPNYFCDTPPWHGYVQTWFDTITPDDVQVLMQRLQTAPPQWILYQRQLTILRFHEEEYNAGKPIAHRALDELIMRKLASGEWKLVDRRNYLPGDGWFLIQTRP